MSRYCTNCGVESSKKICTSCGVKRNATHNFCAFCGAELPEKAAICTNCKEAVKAELSDISGRLKIIRKEVRLCEGISARSDTLKEKLQTIRADENEQRRKELMKNEHRRRSGRTNRPNELGGL